MFSLCAGPLGCPAPANPPKSWVCPSTRGRLLPVRVSSARSRHQPCRAHSEAGTCTAVRYPPGGVGVSVLRVGSRACARCATVVRARSRHCRPGPGPARGRRSRRDEGDAGRGRGVSGYHLAGGRRSQAASRACFLCAPARGAARYPQNRPSRGFAPRPAGVSYRSGYLQHGRGTSLAALTPRRAPALPCATLPAAWESRSCAWVLGRVHGVPRSSAPGHDTVGPVQGQPGDADQGAMRAMRAVAGGCPDTTSPVDGALRPPLVRVFSMRRPAGLPGTRRIAQNRGLPSIPQGSASGPGIFSTVAGSTLAALARAARTSTPMPYPRPTASNAHPAPGFSSVC